MLNRQLQMTIYISAVRTQNLDNTVLTVLTVQMARQTKHLTE